MNRTEARLHLFAIIVIVLLGSNMVLDVYRNSQKPPPAPPPVPPHTYISATADSPTVPLDGVLMAVYTFDRARFCRTDLDRYIIDAKTNEIVWRDRAIGGAGVLGRTTVRNPIPMPSGIKRGRYILRTISYSSCPDKMYDAVAPDIIFEVI